MRTQAVNVSVVRAAEGLKSSHTSRMSSQLLYIAYILLKLMNKHAFIRVAVMYHIARRRMRLCSTSRSLSATGTGLSRYINAVINIPLLCWENAAASCGSALLCAAPTAQAPAVPLSSISPN